MGFKIDISKDGYVTASQLEKIFLEVANTIADRFASTEREIQENRRQIKALREELETERRLRIGMSHAVKRR